MGYQVISSDFAYGDSHPPFMKAIMRITTYLSCLLVCHSPCLQYLMETPWEIRYWALKLSIPSEKSTYMKWRWDVTERRGGIRGAEDGRALKWKEMEEKEKILETTYRKEERLIGLDLLFWEYKEWGRWNFWAIYIWKRKARGKAPARIPLKISNRWIRITLWNVGNMEQQKLIEGASWMPKC